MTIKRSILMLLVMLMSVTGAWAETFTVYYSGNYSSFNRDNMIALFLQTRANKYIKVYLNTGASDIGVGYDEIPDQNLYDNPNYALNYYDVNHVDAPLHISTFDPSNVTITEVRVYGAYFFEYEDWPGHFGADEYYTHTYTPISNEVNVERTAGIYAVEVDYTFNHTHILGDWSTNNNQHWHVCSGTGAACPFDNNITDRANHVYNVDITNDVTAYTCSVCGYVNNTTKTEYEKREYFSMKAIGGNVTIGMTKTGTPANYDLLYSFDKVNWTPVALTATNSNVVDITSGQTCYFRHGTTTAADRISKSGNDYWTFTMTGPGKIEAGGNAMSLLDITVKKTTPGSFAFANLFKGCSRLTKAPKLLATTLNERCYMGMFEGTGIYEAPTLPAGRVVKGAYQNMFRNCLNLETAPDLVATRVDYAGYQDMFNGCKTITAVTLKNNITTIEGTAFKNWLVGTAYETEGIITAPDALVGQTEIMNNLPSNWMFKQIKDYTTKVSNALVGTTETVQDIGKDYIEKIRNATSKASALSLRDEALSEIDFLKKYNIEQFRQPTGAGMRLKVTMKDGKVYEFKTIDIKSTKFSDPTDAGMCLRVTMNGGKVHEFQITDIESTEFYCATK